MATFEVTIWENSGATRGSRVAVAQTTCAALAEGLSKSLGGRVGSNGLLEERCLIRVENLDTGEKGYYPPPPESAVGLEPQSKVPELIGEKRLLEAFHVTEANRVDPPQAERELMRAFVFRALGSLEWRRELLESLELAESLAQPELAKDIAKRLRRARRAKFEPAPNPREDILLEISRRLAELEPEPLDLQGLQEKTNTLLRHTEDLTPAQITALAAELKSVGTFEEAAAILKVTYAFFLKNPEEATKSELKALGKKRKKGRKLLEGFFQEVGEEWPRAVREFYEATEWCPPGAARYLSEEQKADWSSKNRGCWPGLSAAAAFLMMAGEIFR